MNHEPNTGNTSKDILENILSDITKLTDYIIRMKGLGIKVPEDVMISQLQDIKGKYEKKIK